MNQRTFFEKFDVLTDVPDGVQKLREMILLLAVQGKLMPQSREDEPAAVLLEKIKVIKERLAKEGKIKKSNFLPPIRENEIYFKLPTGWQWVRFDDICSYIQRGKGPKYVEKSDIPVVSQKCIQWDGFKLERAKFISPSTLEKYNEERFLITGDLLWNSTGTGTIGRVNVYVHEDNSYDKIVADSHVTVIRSILMNSRFFYCWVASPIIQNEIEEMASGTTNQIELNLSTIKNHLVPLPPLEEQKRIVAKVDQLMALCDELEARQQKKHEQRILLNNAALDKLLTAPTPEKFAQHWQRICDNFDLLYDAPETVGQLRQAILQLAVQGKLVAQVPGDEPALNQLKIIKEIKELNLKQGKLQKDKKYSPIMRNNPPWNIPQSWVWVRLQDILELSRGGSPRPSGDPKYFGGDIPWITVNEITKDTEKYLTRTKSGLTELGITKSRLIYTDDLLLTNSGATLGVPKISKIKGCINDGVARLNIFHKYVNKEYAYYFLFQQIETFRSVNQGMGQPNLNTSILAGWFFPFPPLEEQKRIVTKVDQLMALCNELEAGLVQAQKDGRKLMEAVVAS